MTVAIDEGLEALVLDYFAHEHRVASRRLRSRAMREAKWAALNGRDPLEAASKALFCYLFDQAPARTRRDYYVLGSPKA